MSDVIDGLNHPIERWTFASAAARQAAGGYYYQDIGKIAFQQDNRSYWRLIDTPPTWAAVGGGPLILPAGGAVGNTLYKNSAADYDVAWDQAATNQVFSNPPTVTSTTGVMMGLALYSTPVVTGRYLITLGGQCSNNTAGNWSQVRLYYGTGIAPANGAAVTGNITNLIGTGTSSTANAYVNIAGAAVITGFTLGTQYWFDLWTRVLGGTATFNNIIVTTVEF